MSDEAERNLSQGEKYPYNDRPPVDWAERAALGVLHDLNDRRDIKRGFEMIDAEIREEIVVTLADIIRTAWRAS